MRSIRGLQSKASRTAFAEGASGMTAEGQSDIPAKRSQKPGLGRASFQRCANILI